MRTHSPTSRHHGFTLVELLVVIAIIGVLASLLVPALTRAKQGAYRGVCLNNLRQSAVATVLYADENRRYFFSSVIGNYHDLSSFQGNTNHTKFDFPWIFSGVRITREMKPFYSYLPNPRTAACPGDRWAYERLGAYGAVGNSYISSHFKELDDLNLAIGGALNPETRLIDDIRPSALVVISEHFASLAVQNQQVFPFPSPNGVPQFHGRRDRYLTAFSDGHALEIEIHPGQTSGLAQGSDWTYHDP